VKVDKPFMQVKEFIELYPEQFNMSKWAWQTECGTTFCIAGFVLYKAGYPLCEFIEGGQENRGRWITQDRFIATMRESGYPNLNEDLVTTIIHMDEETAKMYVEAMAFYEETGKLKDPPLPFHSTVCYPCPYEAFGVK